MARRLLLRRRRLDLVRIEFLGNERRTALDEAAVPRVVLKTSSVAVELREAPIVAQHHTLGALNAPSHAFRNIAFQSQLHLPATPPRKSIL